MTDEYDLTISDSYRTPGRRKNNWTASVAPTVNDDEDDYYEAGSIWLDSTNGTVHILLDPTAGAAVWESFVPGGDSGETLHTDTSVSGAHTIDRADGGTHDLTLTGDATFTLAGAFTGRATDLRVILRQDGTGGRTVTWPGSVDWIGGVAPTLQTAPDALDVIGLVSVDNGATWLGFYIGADDQTAAEVPFTPAGTIAATDTQAAIEEVATDAAAALTAHTGDTSDAHDASAISIVDTGGYYTSTDVEGALQEIGAGGIGGSGSSLGPLLLASDHSTPIVFDDILQASDGSDFLYAPEP